MLHYWSLDSVHLQGAWVTIGSFDGVHRGHQEVIRNLTAEAHASGAPAVVLTFYPHPAIVLKKRKEAFYLTTPEEKAALLGEFGVDYVVTHPFNLKVAQVTAAEFMRRLVQHLGLTRLVVGNDFALGRGREGNITRLAELGRELGYQVSSISTYQVGEDAVSSSRVRSALISGDVALAGLLLGRNYGFPGGVIPGDGRGRTIGIPTANLSIWLGRAIPKAGVYVCWVWVDGNKMMAVTNVGYRPTFETQTTRPHIEAHLLDFAGDLYGKDVRIEFIERLRDEQKFSDFHALVHQIHADIARAREIFSDLSK